eukprot:TRINITY_DN47178_c0_g1_i1.p1 TRINITY_DN47178_c0_g1~~TRINITY_DN47178_c0_g1_i1.p1  ORF type:complete len:155 (-),score=10.64 TRINITY_DN47178_c0_g1_i1:97-561(-)
MALRVRPATIEDLPAIIRMLADDELGAKREDYHDGEDLPECYFDAFRKIDQDPSHELVVAEAEGGCIVGTLQLSLIPYLTHRGGTRAQIEAVRVCSESRGTGLGGQLLEWAIGRARERGCRLVQLTTDKMRPDALRFYLGLGFRASHEGLKLEL